jgi:hypothetical protein
VFCEDFSTPVSQWRSGFETLKAAAKNRGIPVYLVTADMNMAGRALGSSMLRDVQLLECDFTAIRSAARTNPCAYVLQQGTVAGKWSYRRFEQAAVNVGSY